MRNYISQNKIMWVHLSLKSPFNDYYFRKKYYKTKNK